MRSERENERVVLFLSGEIDLSNAESLETEISVAITAAHEVAVTAACEVVMDLTAVDFIDSSGLRLLKRVSTAVAGGTATFSVVAPPGSIARSVLDMTRMTADLSVRDSLGAPRD